MSRLRIERLKSYKNEAGPAGEASSKANLNYWADRAESNSLHPGKSKAGTKADGPGRDDNNHLGGTFMPNVRRTGA
ncbi:hypothetical protein [Bradyrhizobium sp. HKCCYLS20291]|uniref:hypothetical protein n=1 Tax=Bradyrhizobium sp. HKCCYLS20291 TaxID=3420766 RepID=UPI003EBB9544